MLRASGPRACVLISLVHLGLAVLGRLELLNWYLLEDGWKGGKRGRMETPPLSRRFWGLAPPAERGQVLTSLQLSEMSQSLSVPIAENTLICH